MIQESTSVIVPQIQMYCTEDFISDYSHYIVFHHSLGSSGVFFRCTCCFRVFLFIHVLETVETYHVYPQHCPIARHSIGKEVWIEGEWMAARLHARVAPLGIRYVNCRHLAHAACCCRIPEGGKASLHTALYPKTPFHDGIYL